MEGYENSAQPYDLPAGVPKELEMRIGWANVTEKMELEDEILNGVLWCLILW